LGFDNDLLLSQEIRRAKNSKRVADASWMEQVQYYLNLAWSLASSRLRLDILSSTNNITFIFSNRAEADSYRALITICSCSEGIKKEPKNIKKE
jgi:hypothetical protein